MRRSRLGLQALLHLEAGVQPRRVNDISPCPLPQEAHEHAVHGPPRVLGRLEHVELLMGLLRRELGYLADEGVALDLLAPLL